MTHSDDGRMFMTRNVRKTSMGAAALAVCALVGATVAFGATSSTKTTSTTGTSTTGKAGHTPETALTGDALAKVKAAAIAKVGGTVDSATTENDSSNTAAVYEAHVTKADGTHVTVVLDSAYAVLSVETGGPGGHGKPGGGNSEAALTGDVATKAKAAAVASAGGTADRATTETDSSNTAAAYEVHVTKADGSHVVVILDKSYAVLSTETQADHPSGPGGGHRH
jgi:uncharacterized membrane protein YkoI